MRKIITAAIVALLLATPALAQRKGGAGKPEDPTKVDEKRQAEAAERAYRNAVKNTAHTAPTAPADPWANTRAPNDKK
jgi:uncharacterized protein YdeI (BOF family)